MFSSILDTIWLGFSFSSSHISSQVRKKKKLSLNFSLVVVNLV